MADTAQMELREDGATLRFPEGFMWGSGISAHQTEGGNDNNDWWDFEQRGGIERHDVSGRATDFWNRYASDIRLAADMGHDAMKISVEWARIEPEQGRFDEDAIEHYQDMLTTMRAAGIRPFVVAHHFTSPGWLADHNWWLGREVPALFADYATVLLERFGDLVDTWCTINEPALVAAYGYGTGGWPPGYRGWPAALGAYKRLGQAHNAAYVAMKRIEPSARVGICLNAGAVTPHQHSIGDRILRAPANWLGNFRAADAVRNHTDYFGLQYYSRICPVRVFDGSGQLDDPGEGEERTDLGWPIYPYGIYQVVMNTWKRYGIPIYITENGLADAADTKRAAFIRDHLAWLHRAMRDGADVRGYLHWATTDNFEWLHGFEPRFGLAAVDYQTLRRTVRSSARTYEAICRSGELLVAKDHPSMVKALPGR